MAKIIIGVHGLGKKPSQRIMKKWWEKSIREGLKSIGYPIQFFHFEFVYWADFLHAQPLDVSLKDKEHPLFLREPYQPARNTTTKKPSELKRKILNYLEKELEKVFLNEDSSINFSNISDYIIKHFFSDLDQYYSGTCLDKNKQMRPVKQALREHLASVLRKHKNKEILLIGHSMGSILSYDVLTQTAPDISIDTLVTIGSPLGIPAIVNKTITELRLNKGRSWQLATPENVQHYWYNLSDLNDKVAFNYELADEYQPNSRRIKVTDLVVYNNYEMNGVKNAHKDFGYLRTPECAKIINEFLTRGRNPLLVRIMDKLNHWVETLYHR